jgi:hypothetical protein
MGEQNLFDRMFDFVVFAQVFMFFMFLLQNIYTLDNVVIETTEFEGTTTEFTFNFYSVMATIVAIMVMAIVASLNIFGGGLNSTGSSLFAKYSAMFAITGIFLVGSLYYLLPMGVFGVIIIIMIGMVYAFKFVSLLLDRDDNSD